MGFLQKLKNALASAAPTKVEATGPGEQYATAVDAIAAVIEQMTDDRWATTEVEDRGKTLIIQVSGDQINTCTEEVDVVAIARKLGLTALATVLENEARRHGDRTLHHLPDASPREIAEIVNGIFLHHYHAAPNYRVHAWLES